MRSKVSILLGKYAQPTIPQGERGKYHNCTNYEVVGGIMPRPNEDCHSELDSESHS